MTKLSVNVNKIALLRNSRGRNFPDLVGHVKKLISLGVKGITVHPRPDERHVTRQDVYDISKFLKSYPDVEFNIEGYPSQRFLTLVKEVVPDQCTLVPDEPGQLTSDHGWDIAANRSLLLDVNMMLREKNIRSSLFLDPIPDHVNEADEVGSNRIELYTEEYAAKFGTEDELACWQTYAETASRASKLNIGVNAGHDLDLSNLARFLEIDSVLEVSIGHALVVESIQSGLDFVVAKYLDIAAGN